MVLFSENTKKKGRAGQEILMEKNVNKVKMYYENAMIK